MSIMTKSRPDEAAGLGAIRAWLDQFWDRALEAFQAEVEASSKEGNP
jgi:hypothetical protein